MEAFVYRDKKLLRCGYTTGTCAALAAKAAATFLVTGSWPSEVGIRTPKGEWVRVQALECRSGGEGRLRWAECAVKKDGGDDYDVTDGLLIFSRAELVSGEETGSGAACRIQIDGGIGVGRVTKPGLDQPVGAAAINSVPRRMIAEAVREVLEECGIEAGVRITVSVPDGEEAAKKTFNPVLGITGGISILGTSGIVEPMSEEALVETIRASFRVLRAEGKTGVAVVPGNMGDGFLKRFLRELPGAGGAPEQDTPLPIVTCSNFIGQTIDMAGELGFCRLLIAGHLGKLVKLGNGIMNTHSREGDGRMDTLISCALEAGAGLSALRRIQASNTTEEAVSVLSEAGLLEETLRVLCGRIDRHVKRRAMDRLRTGVILFDAGGRVLGTTDGAVDLLTPDGVVESPGFRKLIG